MKNVIVALGAGQIGQAIARRVGVGEHVLLADLRLENAPPASLNSLSDLIVKWALPPGTESRRSLGVSRG